MPASASGVVHFTVADRKDCGNMPVWKQAIFEVKLSSSPLWIAILLKFQAKGIEIGRFTVCCLINKLAFLTWLFKFWFSWIGTPPTMDIAFDLDFAIVIGWVLDYWNQEWLRPLSKKRRAES